jgi:hypothetical protein
VRELIYALATWRLSYLLVSENGPWHLAKKLRLRTGIVYDDTTGFVITYPDWNPLSCLYCTSLWVATGLFLAPRWLHRILAASAIAIFFDRNGSGN